MMLIRYKERDISNAMTTLERHDLNSSKLVILQITIS